MDFTWIILLIVGLYLFGCVMLYFSFFMMSLLDDISIAVCGRPLYIHFYLFPKTISVQEESILKQQFLFYNNLSIKNKKYFRHRLARFKDSCQFIPKDDFQMNIEVKVLISATYVMLTFGMRKYLLDVLNKIIIYPDAYYSTTSEAYHQGEFNPRMKAVVFSWKHFYEGFLIDNNNLNLGLHEFAHVIHHNSMRSNDASALAFKKHFANILLEVSQPNNKQRLVNSDYFRIYAYTNKFEFISVLIEHYFETPLQFQKEFPKLYIIVSKMLNQKH